MLNACFSQVHLVGASTRKKIEKPHAIEERYIHETMEAMHANNMGQHDHIGYTPRCIMKARREFAEERAELLALLTRMKNSVEKLKDTRDLAVLKAFKVRVKEILFDVDDLIKKRA
jgi:hypothetical protein